MLRKDCRRAIEIGEIRKLELWGCFRPQAWISWSVQKPPRSSRWTQKSGSSRGNGFRQLVLCARDSSTMTLLLVCLASLCHRLIPPRTRQSPREREEGVEWPSPLPLRYSLLINSVVSSVPRHGRGAWLGIFFRLPIGRRIREERASEKEREKKRMSTISRLLYDTFVRKWI